MHPFEIILMNNLKIFITSDSSRIDVRSITLIEFDSFWLETSEEERYSSKSTVAALFHPNLLSDNNTSNKIIIKLSLIM